MVKIFFRNCINKFKGGDLFSASMPVGIIALFRGASILFIAIRTLSVVCALAKKLERHINITNTILKICV